MKACKETRGSIYLVQGRKFSRSGFVTRKVVFLPDKKGSSILSYGTHAY